MLFVRRRFVPSAVAVPAQAKARRAFKDAALEEAGQWGTDEVESLITQSQLTLSELPSGGNFEALHC